MIRKRGNKWYYRIETMVNGELKRVERVGGDTRKECELALAKVRVDASKGIEPLVATPTLEQFAQYWLDHYVSDLADNSRMTYTRLLKNHILPGLGKKQLAHIRPIDIQMFLDCKRDYSKSTISSMLRTLHCILRYAVVPCGHLAHNPADGIRVPKSNKEPYKAHVWTKQELQAIFEKFPKGHDYYIPIQLMYHTGCRIGEVLALKWDDIDLNNDTVYIHSTMLESGVISPVTKNMTSTRTIPFSSKLHAILMERLKEQKELSAELNRNFPLVCCRNNARRISTADMRYFNMWCKETFGRGTLHTFRHTHATMLLEIGESLEMVSKRLGHSNINMTAKTYSHILEARNRKMVKSLEMF